MTRHSIPMLALALAACGPMEAELTPGLATSQQAQGGGRFEIAANSLFYNARPLSGEASFLGAVAVTWANGPLPADTSVTFNGVPLVFSSTNGWHVDPAGPQPQPLASGQLTISATSASAGLKRTLTLTCASDEVITADPPEGSALGGTAAVNLSWDAALVAFDINTPVQEYANATLWGYDASTDTLGLGISFVYAVAATGTSLAVGATSSPGYAAEVKWPGQYVLDGNSGGQCGRVKRLLFGK
jgi:hypothetical protein